MNERGSRLKCVVFDAVGTLIHARPSVGEVYQAAAARQGVQLTLPELSQRFQRAMSARPPSAQTSEAMERQFWKDTVGAVIGPVPDPAACFEELYSHFARPEAWQLDPQGVPVLQALRRNGIQTAIASNFDERLSGLVETLPGLQGFGPLIISSQVGWRKPHPEFFRAMLRILHFPADELLMVGDDLKLDVLPAREQGISALHLHPQSARENRDSGTIGALPEILKWCEIDEF